VKRLTIFIYGAVSYAVFLASLLYAVAFLGNWTPGSIDAPATESAWKALAIDAGLLSLFALQHSIMARQWFKRAWTRIIPEPAERSTYVLLSSVLLLLLFRQWRPIGGVIWNATGTAGEVILTCTFAAGLLIVLLSTFLINHFDLFGMRQVYLHLMGKPYTQLQFRTPFFYRFVRHPLYVGWLLTFWSAPVMTAAHLLFAGMTTAYILVAIQFEEADLVAMHGEKYSEYRRQVPMIVPSIPAASQGSRDIATANSGR